jgi:hypothetical protein
MSKKVKQPQKPVLEPMPPTTAVSSVRSLWRRNGLFFAIGLFVMANVFLIAMDNKVIAPTAFGMITFLTIFSIIMAISYGLQYLQVKRRAALKVWSEHKWKLWREGF